MIDERELGGLDAMLENTLDALLRRASAASGGDLAMVDFGVGEASQAPEGIPPESSAPTEVEELWQLVEYAREPDRRALHDELPVGFAVGHAGPARTGRLTRLYHESAESLAGLLASVATPYVFETRDGSAHIRTHMGWLGTTRIETTPGVPPGLVSAHVAAAATSLTKAAHYAYLLTRVVSAAARIATAMTIPGGIPMALPIAYKCVVDVHRRWQSSIVDPIG